MATITALTPSSSMACTCEQKKLATVSSASVLGLPTMAKKGKVVCAMMKSHGIEETESSSNVGVAASLVAAASAAMMSSPATALVDERMTTEGTGLPFGLSNNLLGWILLGVFGLIWSLYIVYASSLEEDEDSGLSL